MWIPWVSFKNWSSASHDFYFYTRGKRIFLKSKFPFLKIQGTTNEYHTPLVFYKLNITYICINIGGIICGYYG